jgi:hypothetical protein
VRLGIWSKPRPDVDYARALTRLADVALAVTAVAALAIGAGASAWVPAAVLFLALGLAMVSRQRGMFQTIAGQVGLTLFLVGLAARVVGVVAIWVVAARMGKVPELWFPDGLAFDLMSQRLAQDFLGQHVNVISPDPSLASLSDDSAYVNVYTRFFGFLYVIFGYQPLLAIVVNCLLGSLTGVFVYLAARRVASVGVAACAGLLVSFVPSVFLWSLFNLREAAITCAVAVALWAIPAIVIDRRWWAVSFGFAALLVLERLRFYAGVPAMFVAVGVLVLALIGPRWRKSVVAVGGFVVLATLVPASIGGRPLGIGWALTHGVEDSEDIDIFTSPERVEAQFQARGQAAVARALTATALAAIATPTPTPSPAPAGTPVPSGTGSQVDLGAFQGGDVPSADALPPLPGPPPGDVVALVLWQRAEMATYYSSEGNRTLFVDPARAVSCQTPSCLPEILAVGIPHVLFAPLPWDMTAVRDLLTLPELPVWLASVMLAVAGVVLAPTRWREWSYAAASTFAIAAVLALFDVNSGTVLRHRAMLLPGLLVVASLGVQSLRERRDGRVRLERVPGGDLGWDDPARSPSRELVGERDRAYRRKHQYEGLDSDAVSSLDIEDGLRHRDDRKHCRDQQDG